MKRILLTTVSLGVLALASPALGADLAVKAAPPPAAVYDWTGYYIGGFGGYAFGNQNLVNGPITNFAPFTANWETHGAFGGGEIGGYWQSGQFVWGVQADGFGSKIQGQDNFALTSPAGNPVNDANQLKWAASLRAQGGIAMAFTDMIIGKIEYRYYDLGTYGRNAQAGAGAGLTANGQVPYTVANTYSAVLAGIDFKFGGGTVVAKY